MKSRSLCLFRHVCLLILLCFFNQAMAASALLSPSLAFRPAASVVDDQTLEVTFSIADGNYLYRNKFSFTIEPAEVTLGQPIFPSGTEVEDENFGMVEVYQREVRIRLPINRMPGETLPVTLTIGFQGCAQAGLCYPPQKHVAELKLPALSKEIRQAEQISTPTTTTLIPTSPPVDEASRIALMLENENMLWAMASFFGFGLLLSMTPCVFPMFPILSSIIVGAGRGEHKISHQRGFMLSLAYVLGMAFTYTLFGIIAGLTGTLFASALQTPQFLYGAALLLFVLALSMLGFYELSVPALLQNLGSQRLPNVKGGSLPAVALMGILSTVLTSACVVAPLAGALIYIGKTANALLGGLILFSMALGMGVPLLVIGASAGSILPKSGAWMNTVKKAFGYILIGTAIWIVTPVIPPVVMMWAWALLLILLAVNLRTLDSLPPQSGLLSRVGKAFGVVFLLAGAAIFVGALSGSQDPIRPLAVLQASAAQNKVKSLEFAPIRSLAELETKLAGTERPVMLMFSSQSCKACRDMENYTFTDPRVQKLLAGWQLLKADVSDATENEKALLAKFNLYGTPSIIFFDATGKEVTSERVIGYQNSNEFLGTVRRAVPE